jgi:hypothetical protein
MLTLDCTPVSTYLTCTYNLLRSLPRGRSHMEFRTGAHLYAAGAFSAVRVRGSTSSENTYFVLVACRAPYNLMLNQGSDPSITETGNAPFPSWCCVVGLCGCYFILVLVWAAVLPRAARFSNTRYKERGTIYDWLGGGRGGFQHQAIPWLLPPTPNKVLSLASSSR